MFRLLSTISALLAFAFAAFGQSVVRVAADSTVTADVIRLGDIAVIDGAGAERLKLISLGYAPNIGMTREFDRGRIALSIAAAGFSDADIRLDAPVRVLVRRAGQTVTADDLRRPVEEFLAARFKSERVTAEVRRIDFPGSIVLPAGKVEIRPNFTGIASYFQSFLLPIEIRVDGVVVRRLSATVEVTAEADVVVAARELAKGKTPAAADVRLERRTLTMPLGNYLRDLAQLRGVTLVKDVAAGQELTADACAARAVIKAGDPVRVEATGGSLKIVIAGEARSSGRIGDRIAVKNLQSGAIVQAVVIDEGVVSVRF